MDKTGDSKINEPPRISYFTLIFRIRISYLRAALNQDFAYFDLHQTGDFASRIAEDMIKLEEGIGDKVSSLVHNAAVSLSCIIMALIKGWKLALLCLSTAPITFFLVGVTGKIANNLYKKQAKAKAQASAVAEEVLGSIKTVYAFNAQQYEIKRYKKHLANARRIFIRKEIFTGMSMGLLYLCVFSSYAMAFYIGIYLILNEPEKYNADVMFSVFFGVMTALTYVGMIGSLMSSFGSAQGAGAQVFHILDNVPTINPLLDRGIRPDGINGVIELKDVVFHYPSRPSVLVLDSINIDVRSGQTIALVGNSGCGKTTIIQLISRFYDVDRGSVRIDGRDVRELSVRWLRHQIGLVRQEPVLFNTSIFENIRLGSVDVSYDDVITASKQANAHEFIMELPSGYETLVGDRGASLSGGQKQRVAIARALVRNPRILLLDEATSALDTVSETKVQEALNRAAKGRTTIVIAHRLSTIRNVDKIFVMQKGRVVETGNHEELIKKGGEYYHMFTTSEQLPLNEELQVDDEPSRERSNISKETVDLKKDVKYEKETSIQALSFREVIMLNAPEWKIITLGSICSIISGFSMPLFIVVFGDLFGTMSSPDPAILMNKVKHVSVICIIIGSAMGLSNAIETLSFGAAGAYLTERLRMRMFKNLLVQDVAFYDERENSPGALCARLSAEAAYVQGATGQRIGIILQGVGSIGLALFLAMWFEWRVGMVALAFLPLVVIVIWQQTKATDKESQGYAKALENSTKIAVEALSNIRTVACLGREPAMVVEYAHCLRPARRPAVLAAHWRGVLSGLSRSMFNFINAAALTYGGHVVADGVPYQDILITTQSLQMASSQAQSAFAYAPDFQRGINAAARIVNLINMKPTIVDPEEPTRNFVSKGNACFEQVRFKYPCRPTVKVLRGVDLKLSEGETVVLVGESGCGKSTVIQLLQRYYDPDSGTITLENKPLTHLRVDEVRANFALVSQEPTLFERSIRENVEYGDISRPVTMKEIVDATKLANIHDFIVSLPQGYETNIGSKGIQLSGGQKQRVAIARALIRQPKILLLDEATSALDGENEKVVLSSCRAGRTCILVSHRPRVIASSLIHVLAAGRVLERGTHEQLMGKRGLYYTLNAKGQ
ncbi:phosphatidylcholine translocator ABCB4-like isoform X2 [Danaus plexippus]|uniref:phosphatidylcholine translocator ABCB4-like isoform X2 n=1 Tax=Danaus plexippus TaxID=13037 RepID=UPI002AB13169|nr:phosphatidylcholine translocator ABCB4-like isoform X2 [Danaus plexippus]